MASVSYSGMRLKQKGRGFDPHFGRRVVSLSKIGLGSTHFMTDSGKQRSFYTLRNWEGGGGVTCTKVTCIDPELSRGGGGGEGAPPDLSGSILGGSSLRPGVFLKNRMTFPPTVFAHE